MTVLYISNRYQISKTEAMSWFKFYCEEVSFHLKTNLTDAKEFLKREVIVGQKHVDFIITDWKFGLENAMYLLNWLKELPETYSDYNFQFKAIPVVLIEDKEITSTEISKDFAGLVSDFPNDYYRLRTAIKSAIKNWRYSLANDLDLVGLDPKTQKIYPGQRSSFISYYKLEVLSRQFVDNKSKQLNYIWTNPDNVTLNNSNDDFSKKMTWTMKNRPRDMEKQIHQFFLSNPTFIKGEDFTGMKNDKNSMHYEKRFYKNNKQNWDIPDFMNEPLLYSLRFPEVFEIKRQSQKILRYGKEKFSTNAKKSFEQVQRYKQYMTSDDPSKQYFVKYHLGKLYKSFEYTLLMGSMDEKQENEDIIERLKNEFEFEDINLVTYQELLGRHIRLCNRLNEFNIF